MGKIIIVYGAIAGAIVTASIIIGLTLTGVSPHGSSVLVGYLIMVVALSMIFIGIKSYRDGALGGVIKFLPAFLIGLGIAAVAGVIYVGVWEIYLAATDYAFMDQYTAAMLAEKQAAGLSGAALEAEIATMEELKANYANPLFRMPMTFIEIFPVGLIIALISAALLRNPKLLPKRA